MTSAAMRAEQIVFGVACRVAGMTEAADRNALESAGLSPGWVISAWSEPSTGAN
jgi:hypothetical protein